MPQDATIDLVWAGQASDGTPLFATVSEALSLHVDGIVSSVAPHLDPILRGLALAGVGALGLYLATQPPSRARQRRR